MGGQVKAVIAIVILLVFFVLGVALEHFDLRFLAISILIIIGMLLAVLPIRFAFWMLNIYLGFEGFAKIVSFYHPMVHVGVDILVFVMSVKVFVMVLLKKTPIPEQKPPLIPIFLLHWCWFLITFANPYALSLVSSIAGVKMYVTIELLYFYAYYLIRNLRDVKITMGCWVFIVLVQVPFALYQGSMGPSSVLSIHPGFAKPLAKLTGEAFRPFGLTHLPGTPAVYISLTAPFVFYFLIRSRSMVVKILMSALIPGAIVTMFLCQIRSALLKAMIATSAYLVSRLTAFRRGIAISQLVKGVLLAAAVVGLVLFATPKLLKQSVKNQADNIRAIDRTLTLFDYDKASTARAGAMERFLSYTQMVPLGAGVARTGAAFMAFEKLNLQDKYFQETFFTDNFWVLLAVDLGIPGVIFMTIIVVVLMFHGSISLFTIKNTEIKEVQWAIMSSMFAICLGFFGSDGIVYNPDGGFFWIFAGIMMKLRDLDLEQQVAINANDLNEAYLQDENSYNSI